VLALSVIPSHQTHIGVMGDVVNTVLFKWHRVGLVCSEVPGATPNRPYSGLIA